MACSGSHFSENYVSRMWDGAHANGDASSYGSYYNFFAVTAGTATTDYVSDGYNLESDICPKNWSAPTATQGSAMASSYASSWNKVNAGYYYCMTTEGSVGNQGNWWTRTTENTNMAWLIRWYQGTLRSEGHNTHHRGCKRSLRCVAQ